jgi:precorrin-6A synthase
MRKVFIIGIGVGNPDYVTIQALNEVDVFFIINKGQEKDDFVRLRKEICERYIEDKSYRFVELADPSRDRTNPSYESAVRAWHEQRYTRG